MMSTNEGRAERGTIVYTSAQAEMQSIRFPHVQAVIYTPKELPWWFDELREAVRAGMFRIAKIVTDFLTPDQIEVYLSATLPCEGISEEVREAVKEDILGLVGICQTVTGATYFQLRYMTATPNRRFGFHVDLAESTPTRRIIRVYGEGTEYVEPSNITSMGDFYYYVSRRERLGREVMELSRNRPMREHDCKFQQLVALDDKPSFLRQPQHIHTVPLGSIVAVETVPTSQLWPQAIRNGKANGWVHRSPFISDTRFLITVTNARV